MTHIVRRKIYPPNSGLHLQKMSMHGLVGSAWGEFAERGNQWRAKQPYIQVPFIVSTTSVPSAATSKHRTVNAVIILDTYRTISDNLALDNTTCSSARSPNESLAQLAATGGRVPTWFTVHVRHLKVRGCLGLPTVPQ